MHFAGLKMRQLGNRGKPYLSYSSGSIRWYSNCISFTDSRDPDSNDLPNIWEAPLNLTWPPDPLIGISHGLTLRYATHHRR